MCSRSGKQRTVSFQRALRSGVVFWGVKWCSGPTAVLTTYLWYAVLSALLWVLCYPVSVLSPCSAGLS